MTQTRIHHSQATLDLEPNRLILHVPDLYALNVPLEGDVDVDVGKARAEWRVEEKKLVVWW